MFSGIKSKRCVYCQQLSPVDAEFCQHCMRHFEATDQQFVIHKLTRPTNTSAASHQAGHYSGLHPEDQPYQSNLMAAQNSAQPPQAEDATANYEKSDETTVVVSGSLTPEASFPSLVPSQLSPSQLSPSPLPRYVSAPTYVPPRRTRSGRAMPLALIAFCVMLLVVGSLLAYMFIGKRGGTSGAQLELSVVPGQLHVGDTFLLMGHNFGIADVVKFTSDTNLPLLAADGQPLQEQTDGNGGFKVSAAVPANWIVGTHRIFATDAAQHASASITITVLPQLNAPPGLQVAAMFLDLGVDKPGVLTRKPFTLSNSGGGNVSWSVKSDQPWLSTEPLKGTFKTTTSIIVRVDRTSLALQGYTGHLTFIQTNSDNPPQVVTVSMQVNKNAPGISGLLISTDALSYTSGLGQNPFDQTITLQNVSNQPIDWTSDETTDNSVSWITAVPGSGHLEPHASTVVTVQIQSQQLPVGNYQGRLIINGKTDQPLPITLDVVTAANMQVPSSLTLVATAGQSSTTRTLNIQNSGGQSIDWQLNQTTQSGGSWLSTTTTSGHLDVAAQSVVTVAVNARNLNSGSYQGTLTFNFGYAARTCTVFLTVIPSTTPEITLDHASLNFTTAQGSNPTPRLLMLTNSGGQTLNWQVTSAQNNPSAQPGLTIAPLSGSLDPGQSVTISVAPLVDQLPVGLAKAALTVVDARGDPGVQSQQVSVTIKVQ